MIPNHLLEAPLGELIKGRDTLRMTEQALGCENNQRHSDIAMELTPQHMEKVGRSGAVYHLQVEIGAKNQEPLHAAA